MKAIEYYQKYKDRIMTESLLREGASPDEKEDAHHETIRGTADCLDAMMTEIKVIRMKRHSITTKACESVVKEMNQRWNSMCAMFEKEYGMCPVERNALTKFYKTLYPTYTI